jgi:hypothetical protein
LTFKDLKRRVTLEKGQQQSKLFERLLNKPFWIWNKEEHKLEDIKTNGDCCFNHIIGLPQKDGNNKPLYDYERIIFYSLVTPNARLSNALIRVEEILSRLMDECGKCVADGYESLPIPEHNIWNVTMWHFGADASIEYTGEKFSVTWEVGENALIRAYSKHLKGGKTRIRLERQEYPRKTFADAIEEKLNLNTKGSSNYY